LAATALVLAAEAVAALIVNIAIGGNSGVAIIGSASLVVGVLENESARPSPLVQ